MVFKRSYWSRIEEHPPTTDDPLHLKALMIPVVVAQHAAEAAFLWLLRDVAAQAPHYSLDDLARLDDRLDAHMDGLRIAADAGWEICEEALREENDSGALFAAAVLAFESGDHDHIQAVLDLGTISDDLFRGVVSALGWLSYVHAEKHITELLTDSAPALRRIGIAASSIHRKDTGQVLIQKFLVNGKVGGSF